ncbi:hypothetical protein FRB95_011994 [Tulasnella sp. JGI-2019a]|nr:hypothetical protein FRB95_011994 [Tulasnella sp. JGI-2019a]
MMLSTSRWSNAKTAVVALLASVPAICASKSSKPSSSPSPASDLISLYKTRIPIIAEGYPVNGSEQLNIWINSFNSNGTYSGVDYTTGCTARTANWPAEVHWVDTVSLAAAYIDAYPHNASLTDKAPNDFIGNATVKNVTDSAMNYWFANDFTDLDCLDDGGTVGGNCTCGTPGFWNENWFSNVIYIPRPATQTCLLLNSTITTAQRASCVHMGQRSFDTFARYGLGATSLVSWLAGANILDIASIGVNVGILRYFGGEPDAGLQVITDAYGYVHNEVIVQPALMADGIRPDGSFGQHVGILYNGNYGKDYTNLILSLELSAAGTHWQGNATTRSAVELLVDGSQWMIYRNSATDVLHWDVSTIGRMITFSVNDYQQAPASINVNLTQIEQLGMEWNSTAMTTTARNLADKAKGANAGKLVGNRMFWIQDYMVHRGPSYVTTVKMASTRTKNSECTNAQNPLGFHLGQGASYTYALGSEYEDIANAWDWNIIPGITTDYGASPLNCTTVKHNGTRTFVGGASDGEIGVAAMDYSKPLTKAFAYRKAWFFFEDDVQHVTVSGVVSNDTAPVFSVLDQKRVNGPIYVNGEKVANHKGVNQAGATSLWHSHIGYTFDNIPCDGGKHQLNVTVANRTGNWSEIGISAQPPATVELFSALLQHPSANLSTPLAYSIYPGTDSYSAFKRKARKRSVMTYRNDAEASAVVDSQKGVVMAVFWAVVGGSVDFPKVSVACDHGAIVIFNYYTGNLTIADPTQTLTNVTVTLSRKGGHSTGVHNVTVALEQGVTAGKSVTVPVEGW